MCLNFAVTGLRILLPAVRSSRRVKPSRKIALNSNGEVNCRELARRPCSGQTTLVIMVMALLKDVKMGFSNSPLSSSIASPICQERYSERTFPIFAFSSWFSFFFPDFFPLFLDFWKFCRCQGWHSAPLCHPSGYATASVQKTKLHIKLWYVSDLESIKYSFILYTKLILPFRMDVMLLCILC